MQFKRLNKPVIIFELSFRRALHAVNGWQDAEGLQGNVPLIEAVEMKPKK